jgi:hypothetical protein
MQNTQNTQQTGNTRAARTARPARRTAAAVAVAGLAIGALLLGGGTATAKSAVTLAVSAHSLRVGQSVRVTGSGGDDSARSTYVCVDTRTGSGGWHTVSCATRPYRPLTVSVRAVRRGTMRFRARLLTRQYPGGPLRQDRVSATTTVLAH